MSDPNVDEAVVRAITFDGDYTLWDVRAAAGRALQSTVEALNHDFADRIGRAVSASELANLREQIAAAASPTASMADIRRASFAGVLARRGIRPPPRYLDDLLERFLDERMACTTCYPDVLPALRTLAERYPLGLITNGNTPPARIELDGFFDHVHVSEAEGLWKPDRRVWAAAAAALDVPVAAILHVGDNPVEDYDAARRAGCRALLLCRNGTGSHPDVASAADLTGVVELLGCGAL